MVVLMGDDEEQHHANIEDYRKKSKPRLIFEILQKVKAAPLILQL